MTNKNKAKRIVNNLLYNKKMPSFINYKSDNTYVLKDGSTLTFKIIMGVDRTEVLVRNMDLQLTECFVVNTN